MFSEEQIQIVRKNFLLASKEFDFEFVSPFALTDEIEAFAYITNYGSKNGAVICLTSTEDYKYDKRVIEWCKKMDCFCSFLNIDLILGEYRRSYFREMLRDWGRF